jgi:hypothetical protein
MEFWRSTSLLYSVSGQNINGTDLQFSDSDWPKLWKSEYHFGRQLSQLFDGPINGSKRLAIYEIQQSETRPDAKITFLVDHTFLYKTSSWQNFAITSSETSHMKNVVNELSFPLGTHTTHFNVWFDRYGILKSCFSSGHVMDRLNCSCSVRFLGHKMGDTC